ncbi:MAG: hypothetical protein HGB19_03615 [Chlorobiales bacterium]|jgi:hypothetical protein|nr:hypothetical protein [Chlorobiales bacterium]
MRKKAVDYFLNGGLNCAQATMQAYQDEYGIEDESQVDALFAMGRGRAEGEVCGALYAAKKVLDPIQAQKIHTDFIKYVETVVCWQIRAQDKISCAACVDLTAQLLQRELKANCEMKSVG